MTIWECSDKQEAPHRCYGVGLFYLILAERNFLLSSGTNVISITPQYHEVQQQSLLLESEPAHDHH